MFYGPMAQDFNEIFEVGNGDLALSTQEIDGITIVAVQALAERNMELEKLSVLQRDINTSLEARITELENKINQLIKDPLEG